MDLVTYRPTDEFFGTPYIDVDEQRAEPEPHRFVHGGFNATATRFAFYFPPADRYEGRFLQSLEGGAGGNEQTSVGPISVYYSAIRHAFLSGAYLVESNQGHIGQDLCPKGGEDSTIYGYRASAEVARLSKEVARLVYGELPHHGYVFGGSGGGCRTIWCVENVGDVWDGAVPFKIGYDNTFALLSALNNTRRVLGRKLDDVIDACEPGGSGNPFDGLSIEQREELAVLYRMGFPRGAERSIAADNFALALWALEADSVMTHDPEYFADYWELPGFAGGEPGSPVAENRLEVKTTVKRVVTASELAAQSEDGVTRLAATWVDPSTPLGLEVEEPLAHDPRGAEIRITGGEAAGLRQFCLGWVNGVMSASSRATLGGDAVGFGGVRPGDEVTVNNGTYLAYLHYYRHHIDPSLAEFGCLCLDGQPIYPQRRLLPPPVLFGGAEGTADGGSYTGRPLAKTIVVQFAADSTAWPPAAVNYASLVKSRCGDETDEKFRLWFVEHSEHSEAKLVPAAHAPVPSTRLIDFQGLIGQAIQDVIDWVESGRSPAPSTGFRYGSDSQLRLPQDARERGSIQPVVRLRVGGNDCAQVGIGEDVTFDAEVELPPGAGRVVRAEFDFDGSGTWPVKISGIDGTASRISLSVRHQFTESGTFFPAIRVASHRDGDLEAPTERLVSNLGRMRVVVR